ncbi:MAG TPA: hypothetical protein VK964_08910 [Nocardioidaceae bacterium]|nr:hypothetical protein [Nocardioidaceae bacterium]
MRTRDRPHAHPHRPRRRRAGRGHRPRHRQQVIELLGHTHVRVVPVLDLADQHPVDAYEVPTTLTEALHLLTPAYASPWSSNLTRTKDADHVTPYHPPDHGGPPGQTRLDNLAPPPPVPHRVKTHSNWRLTQHAPGVYEWTSPHGHRYRIDHHGTHPLGKPESHKEGRAQERDRPDTDRAT